MLAKHCGASKIRNAKLRVFLQFSDWARVLPPRSEGLVGYPQAGAGHPVEEEVR